MAASNAASISSAAPRLLLLRRRGAAATRHRNARFRAAAAASASGGGASYLDMWRKAVERERRSEELARRLQAPPPAEAEGPPPGDVAQRRTARFEEMLRVPREERDRVQRRQVIDRAAAALAAAQAVLKDPPPAPAPSASPTPSPPATPPQRAETGSAARGSDGGSRPAAREPPLSPLEEVPDSGGSSYKQSSSKLGTPGPDFWSWLPPVQDSSKPMETSTGLKPSKKLDSFSRQPDLLMEKEQSADYLSLPFETDRSLPPFQSFVEPDNVDSKADLATDTKETFEVQFSKNAAEAARILSESNEKSSHGIHPDGSMWWKETGVEQRPDGVVCKWTVIRGVSADGAVEWEDKYWEASDRFDHKELGSEKSGRDAAGNVWREYWKESMWQDYTCGVMHMEKTADKWGQNGKGEQWQEQWFEHYDSTGKTEKWADKWCSLDPNTPLDVGHAHVWHERWGEKYDGFGGSTKYTDKWAERSEGDGWSKWGDKWDEHFDQNGHGTKQGETWWAGKYGDRWNRTWGEQHNGSGWVHKYGRSSSGEHWDTHVPQETWYERYPHFGFYHCFENSVQLRSVRRQQPPRK
ncbi:hypothetical protein BS78_05G184600 [Paspalum vaginatum]|nr:hypothetical protein BS78_05G184600 [Paspalum vaginatum]